VEGSTSRAGRPRASGRRRITVVTATIALIALALAMPAGAGAASPTTPSSPSSAASASGSVKVIVTFKAKPGAKARNAVRGSGGTIRRSLKLIRSLSVTVPASKVAALRANPLVKSVEIDGQLHAFADPPTGDLEYDNAWGVRHIGTYPVHQAGIKGQGVKVAIIDTGLDYIHDVPPNVDPEFLHNYKGGYDFFNNDANPMDDNGHGTHVAGILAAEHNGYLVTGVAPNVDLYALKVLGADGSGDYSGLIAALGWAVDNDMDVVNMSLGGNEPSDALAAAIAAAYDAGVTLVAASGNAVTLNDLIYGCPVAYPAAYAQVIAVSFTGTQDKLTGFSCTGPQVDLAAPGDNIVSTVPVGSCMFCSPNGYAAESGTSMASPHVAGVAALLISAGIADANNDGLVADDIKAHLCSTAMTASSPPTTDPKYPNMYGCGIVDADEALLVDPPQTGGNLAPVSAPDAITVAEDSGPTVIDVLANDTDPNGDSLVVGSVTAPTKGDASLANDGTAIEYTPNPDANGTDTFTYRASDGTKSSASTTVTVTITPVNDDPAAADDEAGVPAGGSVTIPVLANDTDIDGDSLTVSAVGDATDGTTDIGDGGTTVTYTPGTGVGPGVDSFSYTVSDGAGGSATANVAITIGAASQPPTATNDSVSTAEDTPVTIDLLANDDDPDGDPLRVIALTDPSIGGLVDHGDGTVTYTPNANANGADSFDYTITDDRFGFDTATVSITVDPVNDIPTASSGVVTISANTPTSFQLLGSDVETCNLAFSIVTPPAVGSVGSLGAVACTPGTPNKDKAGITYTPKAGWIGTDTFTYRTNDGTAPSSVATVTVKVTAPANAVHVGDLDNASTKTSTDWTAKVTIKIHKTNESAAGGVLVSGTWSDGATGSATCSTNSSGTCTVSKTKVPLTTTSVKFTVTNVTLILSPYLPTLNHDPDGDSTGTVIVVAKPT
jgi:subtilisin family serine protease